MSILLLFAAFNAVLATPATNGKRIHKINMAKPASSERLHKRDAYGELLEVNELLEQLYTGTVNIGYSTYVSLSIELLLKHWTYFLIPAVRSCGVEA